ncbi:putative F420-dependent oxidoreductase [Nocardioides luteus]|uniref:LLM class F420-dependent oxidoreductase n=1 Tax=Nocardioides luteus TaxID=1844 RepID=A0ABQ5SXH4_9ACTN|nr:TIGR03621 family F420-dependent LLM class oxidoreductase [Nocardioides luteus]MDR7312078.1 putative F420-dependent oxidoreductase [Nocardioides luteus]GGR55940.1 LLM class F420-dependent oxidoreductase [Nocardioides luteus]GLJ68325.1 LLM class F420-dependent oxidoreductase [Nocardioides luteus]
MTTTPETRPFRFGVVAGQAPPGAAWSDLARRVESEGYDTLVMPDNVSFGHAVFPALAAAAAVTTTLRVGTYVLANDVRHPVQVAKEAATLAVLSDGRFELGLGAGRPGSERKNAMLGLGFDRPGVRVDRLVESIGLIKRLLAGETVTVDGPHHRAAEASVLPYGTPPQQVPLLVAGGGPRMLRIAGEHADIAALGVPFDAEESVVRAAVDHVRSADRPDGTSVELNMNLMAVGETVPRYLAGRIDTAALAARGAVGIVSGSPEEMADQLRERRERLGVSYVLVGDELMEAFAPVVDVLAGS